MVYKENIMEDTEAPAQAHKLLGQKTQPKRPKDNGLTRALRSCCIIPQRYILGVVGLLGVCNAYTMRVCLNLAITQMVNRTHSDVTHPDDPYACPDDDVGNNTVVTFKPYAIFDWDEKTQGLILSGFYYGYAATQVPGGYLAEKFGGKWTLGLGLLSTALFTFLTPVVIRAGGATWLFILRVLQGMGEGPTMPALMIMLARWVPPHERSFQGALVFGGAQIGNIFGSFMSGILLADGKDWAYVFYFFGGFGILWFLMWSILCYSTPNTHPYISKKELNYLNKTVTTAEGAGAKDPVPWKAILRSAPVWALVCAAVNALDLSPNYAGSLTSLVNTTSTFAGIVTPYLIGLLTPDSTLAQWRVAFWVCFAVLVGTNVVYCIWADGKQQWWDDVRQYGYPEGWNHGSLTRDELVISAEPEELRLTQQKAG